MLPFELKNTTDVFIWRQRLLCICFQFFFRHNTLTCGKEEVIFTPISYDHNNCKSCTNIYRFVFTMRPSYNVTINLYFAFIQLHKETSTNPTLLLVPKQWFYRVFNTYYSLLLPSEELCRTLHEWFSFSIDIVNVTILPWLKNSL